MDLQPLAEPASPRRPSTRGELRPDAFLQSLEKGLDILEAFQASQPSRTIADIAAVTGHDRATARRALLTLVQKGYLQQDGKHFSLSPKVLGFGYQYLAALPFWAQAHPVLEELSDELNETISIGVLDGRDVVFILRVPAKRLLTFDPSTGDRLPAHLHSLGHVLLASLPEPALDGFLDAIELKAYTPKTVLDKPQLREAIVQARRQEWAFVNSQHEQNLGGISVPIKDRHGKVLAALNVNFIMDDGAAARAQGHMLPRLQLAARRIQRQMR